MTTDIVDPPPDYTGHMKEPLKDAQQEKGSTGSGREPRYIYYRVYTPDGAIPVKSAFDPANPFVGRIAARSVPPPHTVSSLKRCFANAERLADQYAALYLNLADPTSMDNHTKVGILGAGILNGSTPETAYALVSRGLALADENTGAVNQIYSGSARVDEPKYLYYHLYTRVGEDTSKAPFDPNEPALGRIEKIHVCPPHGPTTIKRHIAKVEGKPLYRDAELYEDISADTVMSDGSYISLMKDDCVGSTSNRPIVLIQSDPRQNPLFY
ncbi:hypothetical protein FB451DRAFT_1094605 [Mycena latifolia]|nr:hypothetical protein FB451DRAFT_1094605 [Mycena latifolia]